MKNFSEKQTKHEEEIIVQNPEIPISSLQKKTRKQSTVCLDYISIMELLLCFDFYQHKNVQFINSSLILWRGIGRGH